MCSGITSMDEYTINFPEYPYHVDIHEESNFNGILWNETKTYKSFTLMDFLPTDEEIHNWWMENLQMSGF